MEQYTDSKSAQIGITTMFGILVTTDLVGNTLVCLIIIMYQEMRYADSRKRSEILRLVNFLSLRVYATSERRFLRFGAM